MPKSERLALVYRLRTHGLTGIDRIFHWLLYYSHINNPIASRLSGRTSADIDVVA